MSPYLSEEERMEHIVRKLTSLCDTYGEDNVAPYAILEMLTRMDPKRTERFVNAMYIPHLDGMSMRDLGLELWHEVNETDASNQSLFNALIEYIEERHGDRLDSYVHGNWEGVVTRHPCADPSDCEVEIRRRS